VTRAARSSISTPNYLTIPLAALQAFGQSSLLARPLTAGGAGMSWPSSALPPSIRSVRSPSSATLTAGTMLAMWLGQLITEQGIGNGISIIIFGGIISAMPQNMQRTVVRGGLIELLVFTTGHGASPWW
jgi:preprotein translocase subunit SecY